MNSEYYIELLKNKIFNHEINSIGDDRSYYITGILNRCLNYPLSEIDISLTKVDSAYMIFGIEIKSNNYYFFTIISNSNTVIYDDKLYNDDYFVNNCSYIFKQYLRNCKLEQLTI